MVMKKLFGKPEFADDELEVLNDEHEKLNQQF